MRKKRPSSTTPTPQVHDEKLLKIWITVYDFQRNRLERTYSDQTDTADLRRFFFEYIYISPEKKKSFENRDRAFIRIARSSLMRILTSREFIEYLEIVISLREMTDRLDLAVAKHIADEKIPIHQPALDGNIYSCAYRAATSRTDRMKQLDAVMKSYELCRRVINDIPFSLEDILKFTPAVFLRNSELLALCVTAYRIFNRNKPRLAEYELMLRHRETAYINQMFNGE